MNTASAPPSAASLGDPAIELLELPSCAEAGWEVLRAVISRPGEGWVFAHDGQVASLDTLPRLRAALAADERLDGISALGLHDVADGFGLDDAPHRQDAEAWLWGPRTPSPSTAWNPCASLWRRGIKHGNTPFRHALLPSAAAGDVRLDAAALLRGHRPTLRDQSMPEAALLGARGRPLVLHVLNDWGGGIRQFVQRQMRHDRHADHLALVIHGDADARVHGLRVALYADVDRCALAEWVLVEPIATLALSHPQLRAILASIQKRWPIAQLRISSLIGGSLDLLESELPTVWIAHDGFPFWPCFDQPDALGLSAGLSRMSSRLFRDREPAFWTERIEALQKRLRRGDLSVIAPSPYARQRWCGLSGLGDANVEVIPHGVEGLAPLPPPGDLDASGQLRVLVPGRLRGLKGEVLLSALMPRLGQRIQLLLVGGAEEGQRLARPGIDISLPDYGINTLHEQVASWQPHLALLPSLAPETWGYVLDEMHGLGLPVLCASGSAYADRVGSGGWAVDADAESFAAALSRLLEDTASLRQIRDAVPPPAGLPAHLAAWAARCPTAVPLPGADAHGDANLAHQQAVAHTSALIAQRDAAYRCYELDTRDLIDQRDRALALRDAEVERHAATQKAFAETITERDLEISRHAATREALTRAVAQRDAEISRHAATREALTRAVAERHAEISGHATTREALTRAVAERDIAYGYYERDTADLARQRDVALAQRDAAEQQRWALQQKLSAPLLRLWLAGKHWFDRKMTTLRYRIQHGRQLLRRGMHSLRHRGLRPTLQAAWRHVHRQPSTVPAPQPQKGCLTFIRPEAPAASIIIPIHGKLSLTLACLRSLCADIDGHAFEVIVVDDASPDESADVLGEIPGLVLVRNPVNLGFVGSCNAGATQARGEFLVFLNNDTTVTTGWLTALLGTFRQHPDTGLAGAVLVYPDGRLQEAGGLVFADGSGWNVGRFEDPASPPYRHVRETHYCSGAAIALRRELFSLLGGFDERYAPGYYEDTDLAMQVRAAGYKVRVQPASRVIHHEGGTAGTDLGTGMKRFQVRNQAIFLERWGEVLRRDHPAPGTDIAFAVRHAARRRVLVIDATTPMPDRDSGSLRLVALLRLLLDEGCAVTFFAENGKDDGSYTESLRQMGVEVWTHPALGSIPAWLAHHGRLFQLVIVSRHYVLSPLLPLLRLHAPHAKVIFDTVDLHHLREQREAIQAGDAKLAAHARATREAELGLIAGCDRTWVVSPVEQALLAADAPGALVDVVSNIHEVRGAGPAFDHREGLLFVGGYRHPPNIDAALWLADEILPLIHAQRPDIVLHLVGSEAPAKILALAERPGIVVHGFVEDLEPLLDRVRISVAPLRYGAGVKGKVNQALAHGLPVVATGCAVEGMGLVDGVDALVADDARTFAAAVLRLYADARLWQVLSDGGLRNTETHFSPERVRTVLRRILDALR